MLLPLRRISRLRCSQPRHTRFVTTFPNPIPSYISPWKPTIHKPQPAGLAAPQDDARHRALRVERAHLCQSQVLEVLPKGAQYHEHVGRAQITKLNLLLRRADRGSKRPTSRLQLCNTYRQLKQQFPEAIHAIPDRAWDVMWKTQNLHTNVQSAAEHIVELEKDMAACRGYETVGYRTKHLSDLFAHGFEEQALKQWDTGYKSGSGSPRHDFKLEYLELGAKLHALAGHPDSAREIMRELFDLYPSADPHIMKTVFRAHTSSASEHYHDLAYELYQELKQRLGKLMTLRDYDACFVGFLEARHLPYAKLVFRDMVNEGHLASSDSVLKIREVLLRLHKLYQLGTDISSMTTIGLQAIKILPKAYHSHVYARWIRSAVLENAPVAAGQILDLMIRRRFRPQTVHFNLLLQALMRTGTHQADGSAYVLRAEHVGWQMIEKAREASVAAGIPTPAPVLISRWTDDGQDLVPTDSLLEHIPIANVTTFAIIIKHHAAKLQWETVDYLTRQLEESGVRPNTALMNIVMDNKCRQGKFIEAWMSYRSLTDVATGTPGVFPNGASIRCLWKMLRLALGDETTRDEPNLPRPRELLAETVQWWARCRSRPDTKRFLDGLATSNRAALTSLVMHCFSYTRDLAGSVVALHVLRECFGIFPSGKSAMILQRQASWVKGSRARESYEKNLNTMGRVYDILKERRLVRMNIPPDDYPNLEGEKAGDLNLNLLSEFIRVCMKRSNPPKAVESMIDQAKKESGVPHLSTGDMDAFQVV